MDGSTSPGENTHARLVSPTFALCGRTCKISLWYHMFGVEFGDLEIRLRMADSATERKLLKLSDDITDKNDWIYEDFAVDPCISNFQVRHFEFVSSHIERANQALYSLSLVAFFSCVVFLLIFVFSTTMQYVFTAFVPISKLKK